MSVLFFIRFIWRHETKKLNSVVSNYLNYRDNNLLLWYVLLVPTTNGKLNCKLQNEYQWSILYYSYTCRQSGDTLKIKITCTTHTRKTVCSLPQMSRSLGPGRTHQERRSPGSTRTVTARLSAARPALHPASRGTISLSRAGPYHWTPGGFETRGRCWWSNIYSAHICFGHTDF